MTSLPSSPLTESSPALAQITSSLVVPFRSSSAAVPVIVHSCRAPATLERRPCANAGPTMRPMVAMLTKTPRALTVSSSGFLLQLAADRLVARIDAARISVGAPVRVIISGDSVPRLQEVLPGFVVVQHAGLVASSAYAVVPVASEQLVVLVLAFH